MNMPFDAAPAALPPGLRVYAIGDVHGCDRPLATLLDAIAEDRAARPVERSVLLFLGDLIDRGPANDAVLARVAGCVAMAGEATEVVVLRGNHEAMFLEALAEDGAAAKHWRKQGGDACLDNWGIRKRTAAAKWPSLIPPDQLEVLRGGVLSARYGGYRFAHAGVRPGVSLDAQSGEDLLWIREPFLSSPADFGAVVVHGHTPRAEVTLRPNRIGIDTGAVYGGKLTCLVLEEDRLALIQVPGWPKGRR